jgi:ParB-like chromosome segregation protein Spo0J
MADIRQAQLRLEYSLLKLAARAAGTFRIPMRTLAELLRLSYFEVLRQEGLTQAEIGRRLGQTPRHMRSLQQRLRGDFFAAERKVGLTREVENVVAQHQPTARELPKLLPAWSPEEITVALEELEAEGRVVAGRAGRYQIGSRYVVLASDQFHRRVDALNHLLDGVFQALMRRLVFDDTQNTMLKMISFSANPEALAAFVTRFEGELRREIATLEEQATREGGPTQRFMLGVTLAPLQDDMPLSAAGTTRKKKGAKK